MPKTLENDVTLYSRAEWGAKGDYSTPLGTVNKDIWHNFFRPDVPITASVAEEMAIMRGVESFHIGKGWRRIAYNFVIFKSGRVYEGCGLNLMGAHTIGQNTVSKAVCFGWDGDAHNMTSQALNSARVIRLYLISEGAITRGSRIFGHRDFAPKSCPGNKIYPFLPTILRAPVDTEEEFMITPDSRDYVIKHLQDVFNEILKAENLTVTRGEETKAKIAEDGDFGPWTNAAWKVVAKTNRWLRYRNRRVEEHDWIELRFKAERV